MAIQAQFPSWGSQDWTDNGCGGFNNFCFNVQQQKQQSQNHQNQQHQQQQHCNMQLLQNQLNQQCQRDGNLFFDNSSLVSPATLKHNYSTNSPSMSFYQSMAVLDGKQAQEIDHYVRLQDQRLRFVLQEQRKRLVTLLCETVESKVVPFLRQKDEEIAQAAKRKSELEDQVNRLEMENVAWRRLLQEHQAMIVSLNSTIEQLREKAAAPCCCDNGAEDAESCCDADREVETGQRVRFRGLMVDDNIEEEEEEEDEEEGGNEVGRARKIMLCKCCNSRSSCMLFLPCRHLCSCKACDAFLDSCPVCQTAKKASIEALMA